MARRPETVLARSGWESCGEGCRRWIGDSMAWEPDADSAERVWVRRRGDGHEDIALMHMERGLGFALRVPHTQPCRLHTGGNGTTHALLVTRDPTRTTEGWTGYFRASIGDAVSHPRRVAEGRAFGLVVQRVRVDDTRIAIDLEGNIETVEPGGSISLVRLPEGWGHASSLQLVGGEVLALSYGDGGWRMFHAPSSGDVTVLHTPSGREISGLTADGNTLAWVESEWDPVARVRGRIELWTGTFDGTTLTPRLVRELEIGDGAMGGATGGGLFAQGERNGSDGAWVYAIYRLSDGARATVPAPERSGIGVVYVTPEDMLLGTSRAVLRIDPRALHFE